MTFKAAQAKRTLTWTFWSMFVLASVIFFFVPKVNFMGALMVGMGTGIASLLVMMPILMVVLHKSGELKTFLKELKKNANSQETSKSIHTDIFKSKSAGEIDWVATNSARSFGSNWTVFKQ